MQRARLEHRKAGNDLRAPRRGAWRAFLTVLALGLVVLPLPGIRTSPEDAAQSAMRAPVPGLLEQALRQTLAPLCARKLVASASLWLLPLAPLLWYSLQVRVWRSLTRKPSLTRFGKLQLEGG